MSGVALDTIKTYTATSHNGSGGIVPARETRHGTSTEQHNQEFSEYPTTEPIDEILWRTLVLNRDFDGGAVGADRWKWALYWMLDQASRSGDDVTALQASPGFSFAPYLSEVWEAYKHLRIGASSLGDILREVMLKVPKNFMPLESEIYDIAVAIGAATGGRRLAVSSKGYLGLVPTWTDENDIIAILFGCPAPVILRKHDGWYEILGPCYFHGIMEGETVPGIQSGEYKTQDFELR